MMVETTARFEEIVARNQHALRGYAMNLTSNRDDAEDLIQETLLKAYRGLHTFEYGTNERGWLCTIMRNTFINAYRSKKAAPEMIRPEKIENITPSTEPGIDEDRHGLHDEVANAFAALPHKQREVLYLREFEDLDYEEIADRIRVPVGTVRSRISRGRAFLSEALKDFAGNLGYPVEGRSFTSAEEAQA